MRAEEASFRTELVALLPRLRRFGRTLAGNVPDADDLVQLTCVRAISRFAQFQSGSRLDSWLFTMMRNLWISEMRARRVRIGQGQVEAAESDELRTPVDGAATTYGGQIMALVHALPEGLAPVLLLVAIEGQSYREAAEILDIPIGTVMSRISRARMMLRDRLALEESVREP